MYILIEKNIWNFDVGGVVVCLCNFLWNLASIDIFTYAKIVSNIFNASFDCLIWQSACTNFTWYSLMFASSCLSRYACNALWTSCVLQDAGTHRPQCTWSRWILFGSPVCYTFIDINTCAWCEIVIINHFTYI